jgi:hypothetical protein
MKEVFISANEQLLLMENHACATGITCYDTIREIMADGLRSLHGKGVTFDYEPISKEDLEEFMQWLLEEE